MLNFAYDHLINIAVIYIYVMSINTARSGTTPDTRVLAL